MKEVQNVKLIGNPQTRELYLIGKINKSMAMYLIDNIIAINKEEIALEKYYEEEEKIILSKINFHKLVEEDTGRIGITMRREPIIPIELHINSEGGSLMDGLALINTIKTSEVPIVAIVNNASSMATVVALACDSVMTFDTTVFMIHELAYGINGKLNEHKKEIEFSNKLQDMIDKIILDNSEIPQEELQEWYDSGDDKYIMGNDIIEYGLTNKVIKYNSNRDTTFEEGD